MHTLLIGRLLAEDEWASVNPSSTNILNIETAISVYKAINERCKLFMPMEFNNRMKKRIKQLVEKKQIDFQSKIWLLLHSFSDVTFLKYFFKSF